MRYFTRGWADGELTDEESDRARVAYQARLDEITPRLPDSVLRLAREVNVHDAIIDSVCWDPGRRILEMSLVCGSTNDLVAVRLVYGEALLGVQRVRALRRVALDREVEVLYDEVDLDDDDGTFMHRLLFWPSEELTIDFSSLEISIEPRSDRRVDLHGYSEVDPEDGP